MIYGCDLGEPVSSDVSDTATGGTDQTLQRPVTQLKSHEFKPGIAVLLARCDVLVLPVRIQGVHPVTLFQRPHPTHDLLCTECSCLSLYFLAGAKTDEGWN